MYVLWNKNCYTTPHTHPVQLIHLWVNVTELCGYFLVVFQPTFWSAFTIACITISWFAKSLSAWKRKEEEVEAWKYSHPCLTAEICPSYHSWKKLGNLQSSSVIFCYYWSQNILLFLGANLPYSCSYDRGTSVFSILNNFWCLDQATC